MCAAELRLRTDAHRSVRTRSVTFADDSLTMITATPQERATLLSPVNLCRDVNGNRRLTPWRQLNFDPLRIVDLILLWRWPQARDQGHGP